MNIAEGSTLIWVKMLQDRLLGSGQSSGRWNCVWWSQALAERSSACFVQQFGTAAVSTVNRWWYLFFRNRNACTWGGVEYLTTCTRKCWAYFNIKIQKSLFPTKNAHIIVPRYYVVHSPTVLVKVTTRSTCKTHLNFLLLAEIGEFRPNAKRSGVFRAVRWKSHGRVLQVNKDPNFNRFVW